MGEGLHELRFGGDDGAHRAQPLHVHGPYVRYDADLRLGDAAQQLDLARTVHRHLQYGALVLRGELEEGERKADLRIPVELAFVHAPAGAENSGDDLLAGGFADAAGHPHHADLMACSPVGGQPLKGR